ncbi:MAG: class I SAM-dependent methyltransferase [Pseudomonadota bacterium]
MAAETEATACSSDKPIQCPVCLAGTTAVLAAIDERTYHRCKRCHATFLDPDQLPSRDQERAHYDTHENDPADPKYREFLNRLAGPLLARMDDGLQGLDYGCGPGPALAQMLREAGHTMAIYDPFYEPERSVLEAGYDFITCTEVVEHFHRPRAEFARFNKLLKPGGLARHYDHVSNRRCTLRELALSQGSDACGVLQRNYRAMDCPGLWLELRNPCAERRSV